MYLIDTHVHSRRYSLCGTQSMEDNIRRAAELGLHGFCITEHHHRWDEEEIEEAKRRTGREELVIIPGQEVTCVGGYGESNGDFLIFGCREQFAPQTSAEGLIQRVHGAGGLLIAAHPMRAGMGIGERVYGLVGLDGFEVCNINHSVEACERAMELAAELDLIPTAGSDAHAAHQLGRYSMGFAEPVRTESEFIGALRARAFTLDHNLSSSPHLA